MKWLKELRGAVAIIAILLLSPAAVAAPFYLEVDHFHVAWAQQSELLPSLQSATQAPFRLKRSPNGFSAAAPEEPAMRTTLAALDRHAMVRIDDAGLEAIASAIRDRVEQAGLLGVTVSIAWSPDTSAAGRDRGEVWMIVSAPLPGAAVNTHLPSDLVSLAELRTPTTRVAHIDLAWRSEVPHLPSADAFLDQIKVAVRVRGGRVLPAATSETTVGRLRRMPPLQWSPSALQALDTAVQAALLRLGDDVTGTVTHTATPAVDGGEDLHFVAQIAATEPVAPEVAQQPAAVADHEDAASPKVVSAPTPMPVEIGEPLDMVEVVWGDQADTTWGHPMLLFTDTLVYLRQVDDSIQAGSPETTQPLLVTNLGDMQRLRWRPSATRVLLQAMQLRLRDLGMEHTTLTHEFVWSGKRMDPKRALRVAVEVPPRAEGLPAISKERELDGTRVYPVWPFEVGYFSPHPELPPVSTFMQHPIELVAHANEWTEVTEDTAAGRMTLTLGELNESGPMAYSAQAIRSINKQLGAILTDDGLLGVRVAPSSDQIISTGESAGTDLRAGTLLQVGIDVGRVAEVRTLAAGERIDTEERVGHAAHESIATSSPLKTAEHNDHDHGDLLRQEQLDDYLYFLSRHPGRNVEASVASSQFVGGISLEYTISESKPWTAWFQYGNTGTQSEGYQRYRWGFYTTQLTGNDDILSLQYVTSNFSDTNAVMGSYEAPVGLDGRLRAGIRGSWSQYFADQFGFGQVVSDALTGTSWSGAGELRWNAYQDGPLFIDMVGGLRLQHLSTTNTLLAPAVFSDQASFLIPYGMLRAEQTGNWSQVDATVGLEGNVFSHSARTREVIGLRGNTADKWIRFNGAISASTYLEPLLDPAGWADPSTPKSSTLAHEIYGRISGQYSFGSRLMPQFQEVVGGPDTNRGYPVYVVAGDDVLNLTGEYRFHLPRTFDPDDSPGTLLGEPFRTAPQYVYGRPDWDLVLLGFVDASWVRQSGNNFIESNETLVSAGIGLDLTLKTNMRIRVDWGVALKSLQNRSYDAGQNRLYVQASLYF